MERDFTLKKYRELLTALKGYGEIMLGIDFEPYLDTDFSKCFYLTDTGRRRDGHKVSVRDKIPEYQDLWVKQGLVFHSTDDIVAAAADGKAEQGILGGSFTNPSIPKEWIRHNRLIG